MEDHYISSHLRRLGNWVFAPFSKGLMCWSSCQTWGGGVQFISIYRKVSNTRRTKSQNLIASILILSLSLPNPLKPGVKLRMKM